MRTTLGPAKRKKRLPVLDRVETRWIQDLAYKGFGYQVIMDATGCSIGQVSYALGILGVSPTAWRKGDTDAASEAIREIKRKRETLEAKVIARLRKKNATK